MAKVKLTNPPINEQKISHPPLIQNSKPIANLIYLDKMSRCLWHVADGKRRDRSDLKKFFFEFQSFLYDFSQYEEIGKAISSYGSSIRGGSVGGKGTNKDTKSYVSSIIKEFKSKYPELDSTFIKDSLIHLHLKRGGNGQAILWGVQQDNNFFILDFDIHHKSI